jgi:ATP-dependent Clp protease ATP-binding subunit ClpC
MFERFTDTARRTVVLAQEEARMLNHNYVGTEHLLLALTGDKSLAGQVLKEHGVTRDEARSHIVEVIGEGMTAQNGHIAFTARARETLLGALRFALDAGHSYIAAEHLLMSLVADDKSQAPVAGHAIVRCGADPKAIVQRLTDLMTEPGPDPEPRPRFVLSA